MTLEDLLAKDPGVLIPVIAVGGGLIVAVIAILTCTMKSLFDTKERERSRREIAAYIAEGSMTPDEGERLLIAGKKKA
jgi:hypothetical protein